MRAYSNTPYTHIQYTHTHTWCGTSNTSLRNISLPHGRFTPLLSHTQLVGSKSLQSPINDSNVPKGHAHMKVAKSMMMIAMKMLHTPDFPPADERHQSWQPAWKRRRQPAGDGCSLSVASTIPDPPPGVHFVAPGGEFLPPPNPGCFGDVYASWVNGLTDVVSSSSRSPVLLSEFLSSTLESALSWTTTTAATLEQGR